MNLHFEEFKNEIDLLINFLTSDTWEFYGTPNPNPDRIRLSYENNYYSSDDIKTFWILLDDTIRVGMLRIYDLQDDTPMFDIRILSKYKGLGIGTDSLKWLTHYIFSNYPDSERIEGNTREDNYAMRCVFHKCGFVKEAHYRRGWPTQNDKTYDAIGYAILRHDWESNETTTVNWNDFKC